MYMACRHIMPNGRRCKSPALKGALFCYFHARIHTLDTSGYNKLGVPQLPVPEDRSAIQLSIALICNGLLDGTIDPKRAAQVIWALEIASQNVDKCEFNTGYKSVESATQSPEGDDIAPEERVCTGEDECSRCQFADTCPNYDPDDDDDDDDE